jgi:hypothetical protein
MKRQFTAIAALLALLPGCGVAAPGASVTFRMADVIAKLHDTPCQDSKVQRVLPPQVDFLAAEVMWQGQQLAACWAVVGTQVFIVDETGDAGVLSPEGFEGRRVPVRHSI